MNVINLGTTPNKTMKQPFGTDIKSVPCFVKTPAFTGVTDVFRKKFVTTQKEIIEIFENDKTSDGIAGTLPKNWLVRLHAQTREEKNNIEKKIFLTLRAAIRHLKPYNVNIKHKNYSQHKAELERKQIKESSEFLTKAFRHFGIIPETNSVYLKQRKVHGKYINRGYLLAERGKNPTLEKIFIKTFKKINPDLIECNTNGKYAELAHGLNLNELKCDYISKVYWGDVKADYIATEYESPPRFSSPIVQFKKEYNNLLDFAMDFYKQTGIKLLELMKKGINPGKTTHKNKFEPKHKDDLIVGFLQSILEKAGLCHCDLHKDNAIIGTDKSGKAIVKIVDIGGVTKRYCSKFYD